MLKHARVVLLGLFIIFYASAAMAQTLPVPEDAGFDRAIGAFFIVGPDYEGSDDYRFIAAPLLQFKFLGNRYIQLLGNQLFVNVLNHDHWELGPAAVLRPGRDDVDDDVVDLMEDIDMAFELGGFISYLHVFNNNIRHRFKARISVTQDVTDNHGGLVARLASVYWHPVARAFDIGINAQITLVSDDYMSTYFGVSPADAAASGLSIFDADGGAKDVGTSLMGLLHLSQSWHVGAGVYYRRLLGDAEDSPVVDERGDADQVIAGVGVVYTW